MRQTFAEKIARRVASLAAEDISKGVKYRATENEGTVLLERLKGSGVQFPHPRNGDDVFVRTLYNGAYKIHQYHDLNQEYV